MITKIVAASSVAAFLLASTSMEANARRSHRSGYSNITGRTPNYAPGLGIRKQTRTGGPAGGQTTGSGG